LELSARLGSRHRRRRAPLPRRAARLLGRSSAWQPAGPRPAVPRRRGCALAA